MKLELGIGNRTQSVDIPDRRLQQVLLPNEVAGGLIGETEIIRAVAGDVTAAHRAGCALLDTLYQKRLKNVPILSSSHRTVHPRL